MLILKSVIQRPMLGSRVHASLAVRHTGICRCARFSSTKIQMMHSVCIEACIWHSPQLIARMLQSKATLSVSCSTLKAVILAETAQAQVSSE